MPNSRHEKTIKASPFSQAQTRRKKTARDVNQTAFPVVRDFTEGV